MGDMSEKDKQFKIMEREVGGEKYQLYPVYTKEHPLCPATVIIYLWKQVSVRERLVWQWVELGRLDGWSVNLADMMKQALGIILNKPLEKFGDIKAMSYPDGHRKFLDFRAPAPPPQRAGYLT